MPRSKRQPSQSSASGYIDFVKALRLNNVSLESGSFDIEHRAFARKHEESENPTAEIGGRQSIAELEHSSFSVRGEYKVAIKGPRGKDFVRIDCAFIASFSLEEEFQEDHARRFAGNEVRLILWPYLRQFISDVTMRMSIPPLVLPLTSELGTHPSPIDQEGVLQVHSQST